MRIGVDVGGTKIEALALDHDGVELARRRIPTPRHDYDGSIRAIAELVTALESETGQRGTVGFAIPGVISPVTGLIKNANSVWLNGKPFDRDLAAALGRPVRLANDANCLAVSEATDGAAAGAAVVFAAILGTGCGSGIALDGRPLTGGNAIAGEWGHNPLPWQTGADELAGTPCYCGQRSCVETWISGTGFEDDYERRAGRRITGPEIVAAAAAGDATAEASMAAYEDRLARCLAHVINILDPDVVVLGGGMSNIQRWYDSVPRLLPRYIFGGEVATPVRRARHGDSSGVRGAAWLWPADETATKG